MFYRQQQRKKNQQQQRKKLKAVRVIGQQIEWVGIIALLRNEITNEAIVTFFHEAFFNRVYPIYLYLFSLCYSVAVVVVALFGLIQICWLSLLPDIFGADSLRRSSTCNVVRMSLTPLRLCRMSIPAPPPPTVPFLAAPYIYILPPRPRPLHSPPPTHSIYKCNFHDALDLCRLK